MIAVAATAPAFAASLTPTSSSASSALKWGSNNDPFKHVSWDFAVSIGGRAVQSISVAFTYTPNGGGSAGTFYNLDMYVFSPSVGAKWTVVGIPASGGTNAATANSPDGATFLANTTYTIHTDFGGTDNSTGDLTATVTVTYSGGQTETLPTLASPWKQASPGNAEPAPHDQH